MRRFVGLAVLALAWGSALAPAGYAKGVVVASSARTARPAGIQRTDSQEWIDINRINMITDGGGTIGFDYRNSAPGGEFPKGSGNFAIFAAGIWLGGKIGNEVRLAISGHGSEFRPGIILPNGLPDDLNKDEYIVYKLNRADSSGIGLYNWGALPYGADTVTVNPNGTLNILGDQILWCVYNDADSLGHTYYSGLTGPMRVEVQQTLFGFNRTGALGNTIFMRFKILNKGFNTIDSMFVSMWADPDLGYYLDDLVGCDVATSVGYCYNADNDDQGYYGSAPPAVGFDFFKGPRDTNGVELGMTAFNKYINGTDPQNFGETFNYMRGLFRDGTPYVDPTNSQVTNYPYAGDPVAASGWLDSAPDDRRLMLISGPFRMAPGDTQEVVVGMVIGDASNRLSSISLMRFYDLTAQSTFDQNFQLASAPAAPKTKVSVTRNTAYVSWDQSSENYNQPPYQWEGYVVYQGASQTGPFRRVATYDRTNGITTVLDPGFDEPSGQILPQVTALGNDGGVRYQITIDRDLFRGGPLRAGMPYYFAVTSYAVGIGQVPQVLESTIDPRADESDTSYNVITAIPQTPPGDVDWSVARIDSGPGYGQYDTNLPAAKDSITVTIVDPDRVIDAQYRLGYKPDATGTPTWYLVRYTPAGTDTVINDWPNFSGDEDFPVVDGIQVKVFGLLARAITAADSANVPPNPFPLVGVGSAVGLPFFGGSADFAWNLFGSSLDPVAPGAFGLFTDVEIRLTDGAVGQRGYRYMRSATTPRTYLLQDYVDVPWTVWDVNDPANPRQLNAGWLENEATANGVWDPSTDAGALGNRELIWPMSSDYSPTALSFYLDPSRDDALNESDQLDFQYVLWPVRATFDGTPGGTPVPFDNGDVFYFDVDISVAGAPSTETANDYFVFKTVGPNRSNVALAQSELGRVKAVPNPYFGHSRYELDRFHRQVKLTHLPTRCTVRIFNLAGDLVRTLQKNDTSSQLIWDLQTDSRIPVGSGIYIYHVEAPGIGETTGKVVIFMEKERLSNF